MHALRIVALAAVLHAARAPWATIVHAQAGRGFTTDVEHAEFAARRARVYDAIGPEGVAVMQGRPVLISSVRPARR